MTSPGPADDAVPYPDAVGPANSARRSAWQKVSLRQLQWILVIAVLALTALFGGLRSADHVTPLSLGETYDDGPLRITPGSVDVTGSVNGLPAPSLGCVLVVLDATVENIADSAVDFGPNQIGDSAITCLDTADRANANVNPLALHGIPSTYVAAVRVRDGQPIPGIEPGFSDDYRFVWVVKESDLAGRDTAVVQFPQLEKEISTFRIAEYWNADPARYAELAVPLA